MQHYARALLLVAAVLLVASCSDTDAPTGPTEISGPNTSRLVVDATSTTVVAEPIANPFCPTITPFNVRLGVILRATGSFPVVVTGIRARFTDSFGRSAPQVTLPAPGPTLTFGDPQVVRTFPLILGIGCGTDQRGSVVIFVDSADGRGRRMTEQVSIDVR
jgi:hypothetical protein